MPTYWQDLATLAAGAVLLAGLARVAVHDARDLAIPDRLSLPLIALGLAVGWARGGLTDAVIGALAGYLAFVAVAKTYLAIRRAPGLGRDDAKLFAVGGAWCGWVALPQILLIAAAAAILVTGARGGWARKDKLAFGPYLSFGIALVFVWKAVVP